MFDLPENTTSKLKINVSRWDCTQLQLTTDIALDNDVIVSLGIDKKRHFQTFYELYSRNHISHMMTLRFMQRKDEQSRFGIRLAYEIEEPVKQGGGFVRIASSPKASEVFQKLCRLDVTFSFHCSCTFLYKREDRKVSFILPFHVEDELFDEVRGLRFVKIEQEKILWENTLNLIDPNLMEHRIKFLHEGKCSEDLPQKLLNRAVTISLKT